MDKYYQDKISAFLTPREGPVKSYSLLLAEGVPHKEGLAMLAAAEKLTNAYAAIAGLAVRFPPLTLVQGAVDVASTTPIGGSDVDLLTE